MVWVTLVLGMTVVALAIVGTLVWGMARLILRPPRMSDGRALGVLKRMSPEDLGIPFEPVRFDVRDEIARKQLQIAGWWMPAAVRSDKTVVLLHGYADAKVGSIAWASLWRDRGWNVLAIDLRAHGESGGDIVTGGVRERDDLDQVIDQIRATRPDSCRHIALFGVSMGASVAARVAAGREDIACIVLDSPYLDYARAVMTQMRRHRLPLTWLHPLVIRWMAWQTGATFRDLYLPANLTQARCPVLILVGEHDQYAPPADQKQLQDLARQHPQRIAVEVFRDADHNLPYPTDPPRYAAALGVFLAHLDAV